MGNPGGQEAKESRNYLYERSNPVKENSKETRLFNYSSLLPYQSFLQKEVGQDLDLRNLIILHNFVGGAFVRM